MFSDLCDYTRLSSVMDPEDVAEMMETVAAVAEQVVVQCGGFVNQFYGDGVLSVFGFSGDEDGERSATIAALEIHEQISQLKLDGVGEQLQMHTGIHSGVVFAGEADPKRGKYAFSGDPINVAARLCSAAGANEVFVSEATLKGAQAYFVAERLTLSLKGQSAQISAFRVTGRSSVRRRFEARTREGLTPLVGRSKELQTLNACLHRAQHGQGAAVALIGDAGIGKTRILEEFRQSLDDVYTLRVECDASAGSAPLQPVAQVLQRLFTTHSSDSPQAAKAKMIDVMGTLDAQLERWVPLFLRLLGFEKPSGGGPQLSLDELVQGLTHLLSRIGRTQPLALLIDDWHAADDASRWSLGGLVRSIATSSILVVVATRSVPAADPLVSRCERVRVLPWAESESELAIRELLSLAITDADARRIHEHAGGNPLFVEELCRSQGLVDRVSSIPSTLHGLIQARVERLQDLPSYVVGVASVVGMEFAAELVAELCERGDISSALDTLSAEGLVFQVEQGFYRFRHGIICEVVYETVRLQRRRDLHAKVASWLEKRATEGDAAGLLEALAHHHAGSDNPRRAAHYARLAGDRAAVISAQDRARHHYGVALKFLSRMPSTEQTRRGWIETCNRWAAACVYSPDKYQLDVVHQYLTLAEQASDALETARAHYWLGWLQYALGEQGEAIQHTIEALARAEELGESRLVGQLLTNLGQCYAAAGEYPKALKYLDAGLREKRFRTRGRAEKVPVGLIYGLGALALIYGDTGDITAARKALEEGMELVRGSNHAIEGSLLCVDAILCIWQGNWQRGQQTASAAREIAERVGGAYVFALSEALGAFCGWMLQPDATLLQELERAIQWFESRGVRLYLSLCSGCLAYVCSLQGEFEKAARYGNRTLERVKNRDGIGEAFARWALANQCRSQRDPAGAREHLTQALSCALARGSEREAALARLEIAQFEHAVGERDVAKQQLEKASDEISRLEAAWYKDRANELCIALKV